MADVYDFFKNKNQKENPMQNNSPKIEELIQSIGAIGELSALIRESLIKNGWTREEALHLCSEVVVALISNNKKEG